MKVGQICDAIRMEHCFNDVEAKAKDLLTKVWMIDRQAINNILSNETQLNCQVRKVMYDVYHKEVLKEKYTKI